MAKGRLTVISSLVGILILLVAACAPAVTPTPTATPTPPPIVATPTPVPGVATPTPVPAATPTLVAGMPAGYGYSEFGEWGMPLNLPPPQYGGLFRAVAGCTPSTFDSHRDFACAGVFHSAPAMDGLVRYSPYLDVSIIKDTFAYEHISPNLAEKWEIAPDKLSVTFYLKKGVKWHDGKPFTAKDVVYSFNKLLDPTRSVFSKDLVMVDRVERVDDYTVKVYLKYAASRHFMIIIAQNQVSMQAEHKKDVGHRDTEFLMGTGPFKIKSYSLALESVWVKNPDYHFKGRPYVDGLHQYIHTTVAISAQTMAAGQVDYVLGIADEGAVAIVKRVAPEIILKENLKASAVSQFFANFKKDTPLGDPRVRKALQMTVDRDAACLARYGTLAKQMCITRGGYFGSAPIGRGLPFEEYEKAWGLDKPMDQRVAEAKRLMAEAGYPNGFKTEYVDRSTIGDNVLVVLDGWRRLLNVETVPRIIPQADYFPMLYRGEFGLASTSTVAFTGAMEEWVANNFVTGAKSNWGSYTHPEVDRLYEKLLQEPDFDKALAIFHQVERILIQDIPDIYMYTWNMLSAWWPWVKPQIFTHPMWHSEFNGKYTVIWLDKNDPTYAKRAK